MGMTAPTLTTQRLILRAHRVDDLDACCALWGDGDVVRYIGGTALDRQAVWFRILRYAGMWALLGYGMWVVVDRDSGVVLGEAGLLNAGRGIVELDGVPEAGWVFGPASWGRGLATEAMEAVLAWADAHLDGPSVRCMIEPNNHASVAVVGKLGFVPIVERDHGGKAIMIFDRPARPA